MTIDFNKYVGKYIALRDKIKQIKEQQKEQLRPYNETLEKLNAALLGHLTATGADKVGTEFGTVYRTQKKSASISDMSAFWAYVTAQGDFDLVDKKANTTAVEAFIAAHHAPPPGVNWSVMEEVGVRRASTKK